MIVYRMYIVPFTLHLFILLKRYAHGIFAAGRVIVPTQEKKTSMILTWRGCKPDHKGIRDFL